MRREALLKKRPIDSFCVNRSRVCGRENTSTAFSTKLDGQAAMEYMFLMGLLFAILGAMLVYSSQTSLLSMRTTQAAESVQLVAAAADRIYKMGGGNTTVTIDVPAGVVGQNVSNKAVRLMMTIGNSTGEAFASTLANVTGSIPTAQGRYVMTVEMLPSGVVQVRPS